MDGDSKIIIGIVCMLILVFLGLSLAVYETRLDNTALRAELLEIQKDVGGNEQYIFSVSQAQMNDYSELHTRLLIETERVSILDESVHAKDKRWARIKKVRDAIEETTHNPPPILELTKIASAIVDYSDLYDVPLSLVLGVSKRESNFDAKAVSHANASGLMQIMNETGKEIAADIGKRRYSLFNIRDNVKFGIYYLRSMLDRFDGNVELAIRAYNCGPTYTEKVVAGEYQNYPAETVDYLIHVQRWKKEYEDMGL